MLNEKMEKALNAQLNAELYSSYLYLSMSAYFLSEDLPGMANWMRVQAQEELFHGTKFFDYVAERGGRVDLAPIEGPPTRWESPVAVFAHVAEHERKVTGLVNGLVDLAIETKDHASNQFLQWFVAEQVEEEASANEVLRQVKRAGDGPTLLLLDKELGARVFTPPAKE
jgi:ferritin